MTGLVDLLVGANPPAPVGSSWKWGTVTATGPLRVRVDGDDAPLDVTPDALAVVAVGDRVFCLLTGRRLVVLGKKV